MTGSSTLDPDNFPRAPDRSLGRGHGTGALGPSDRSDTGSDVAGGTAAADLGDADLDSDTDSGGTGERAEVGRESVEQDGADIGVDHIETLPLVDLDEDLDEDGGANGGGRR
ncbi:hypothetical protein ASC94_23835 [Massilia sp. Root418]|uniref:hypothetical protein n=1 Tax=Massilia sp. Root418 TaxID=1736532 RepID=UPI0006F7F6B3|nr:hypothetical protein [Massilia sp. Root418]KQW88455.1 hypothetical protein ASC94_23835 [Massilia sp. Root418]